MRLWVKRNVLVKFSKHTCICSKYYWINVHQNWYKNWIVVQGVNHIHEYLMINLGKLFFLNSKNNFLQEEKEEKLHTLGVMLSELPFKLWWIYFLGYLFHVINSGPLSLVSWKMYLFYQYMQQIFHWPKIVFTSDISYDDQLN